MNTFLVTLISLAYLVFSGTALDLPAQTAPADLSPDEIAGLQYMREEEKLAHDVYTVLYDTWGVPVFKNIAASEQAHTAAVLTLLERYGIEDPAAGNPAGVFANPDLQALYNQLVADGQVSVAGAFYVGATIEETDIADLMARIAGSVHADITLVYENLLRGSSSHLRAYVGQWERATGQTYVPQVLDQATFAAIMEGNNGNGPGPQRGYGAGRWQGGAIPGAPWSGSGFPGRPQP